MLLFELYDEDDILIEAFNKQLLDNVLSIRKSSFEGGDCLQLIVELVKVSIPILAGIICTNIKHIKSKRIKIKYKGVDISTNLKENMTAQEVIDMLEVLKDEVDN